MARLGHHGSGSSILHQSFGKPWAAELIANFLVRPGLVGLALAQTKQAHSTRVPTCHQERKYIFWRCICGEKSLHLMSCAPLPLLDTSSSASVSICGHTSLSSFFVSFACVPTFRFVCFFSCDKREGKTDASLLCFAFVFSPRVPPWYGSTWELVFKFVCVCRFKPQPGQPPHRGYVRHCT